MAFVMPAGAPQSGLKSAEKPWDCIDWSPEIERKIYTDWGKYYSRRSRDNNAMHYYNKALQLSPNDYMTLYYRSQSNRKLAKIHEALENGMEAKSILQDPRNAPINLEICDALYELNQFEDAKAELYNNMRLFTGNKTKDFDNRLIVVDGNIKDSCGDGLSPFILENERLMSHVKDLLNAKMKVDNRPLWKILKEQNECDILSIPETKEEILPPLELARRKRAFDICNQVYIDRSWIDILFLKNLRKNPSLLLQQCKNSNKYLDNLVSNQYGIVRKFLKMIQARAPLYFLQYNKYSNKERLHKFREDLLFRIQYQTRRNMVTVLQTIRNLRAQKKLTRLASYIEEVMGDYVVLKTNRIMPWKIEFINEVYNTLGLALIEQYYVPNNFKIVDRSQLLLLLRHSPHKLKDVSTFVFADRSSHQDPDMIDPATTKPRRMITRLERRIVFAKYPIEKSYLYHQIASIHLNSNHYDECCFAARKAIQESEKCNSNVWGFLSIIVTVKANASLNKTEGTKEALRKALILAEKLNSPTLVEFVDACSAGNDRFSYVKASRLDGTKSDRNST